MTLLEALARKNLISESDIPGIEAEMSSTGQSLAQVLEKRGISPAELIKTGREAVDIPERHLGSTRIPYDTLKYIPEESAVHYKFAPLGVTDGVLEVGLVDPEDMEARDALNFISSKIGMPFKIFSISEDDFKKIVDTYKGLSGEVTKALTDLQSDVAGDMGDNIEISRYDEDGEEDISKGKDAKIIEDAPVTKIVATILRYAIEGNASDVHVEPMRDNVRVRFRVDGILNTSLILPINIESSVAARIKVLSNMKLDEKRKPQDGRFSAKIDGRKIDFRVSTFPTYFGEKVVMRILDQEKGVKKLDEMGLSPRNIALLKDAITRPYGLILISGPTGSGKTTTLYSMLNEIDRESNNVLSLEDPIEYNVPGMSQSQVRPEIGYTFANGLRTTLRQDPDVIMVGEIRDKETAKLAVQAALTGHLVLSTIHTNNAAGVIPRLIDMGVDPYLIAPTLILAAAQRLVVKICPGSGKPIPIEGSLKAMVETTFEDLPEKFRKEIKIPDHILGIAPTPECPSGTRGRSAVFEVLKMDKELDAMLLKSPTEAEIMKVARQQGMLTMKEDGLIKAFNGEIPFEEVNKL
ncbi:MAG: GspE/PulE family protein [Candidatus Pacebacteria bacterium]|nr:GspE/PulE family protein [Candidatus Paceibacterota bacterium]